MGSAHTVAARGASSRPDASGRIQQGAGRQGRPVSSGAGIPGSGWVVLVGLYAREPRGYAAASIRAGPGAAAPVWTSISMLSPFLHCEPAPSRIRATASPVDRFALPRIRCSLDRRGSRRSGRCIGATDSEGVQNRTSRPIIAARTPFLYPFARRNCPESRPGCTSPQLRAYAIPSSMYQFLTMPIMPCSSHPPRCKTSGSLYPGVPLKEYPSRSGIWT
jgi:hypothetical protein